MACKGSEVTSADYSSKKKVENPVAPCQGWKDPCELCNKKFGNWMRVNQEKIPRKPGIFMIGLKDKDTFEVVDITLDTTNLKTVAVERIDHAKGQVADKKSKLTKSVVVCRWMTFKSPNEKDVTSLCAHWYNNGVFPRFLPSWPGLDILKKTENFFFSEKLKKWCYSQKPKELPKRSVELVKGCKWTDNCLNCNSNFGNWQSLEAIIANKQAPDISGIYMIAVAYSKTKEVVNIYYDGVHIKLNVKRSLRKNLDFIRNILREKKFSDKKSRLLVRWMEMNDPESNNCCSLYAHWLNAEFAPMACQSKLPGKQILDKNTLFVLNTKDKRWYCEIDEPMSVKKTPKSKQKKPISNDVEDALSRLNVADLQ